MFFVKLRKATFSFMKFDISVFFKNLSRKLKFHYNWTKIKGTLHEDPYAFYPISLIYS